MAPPPDRFAGAKANLRDTVKWLVAIFAGLAAAVTAGATLSTISGASGARLWIALAGGGGGVIALFVAAGVALGLLTSTSVFLGDLTRHPTIEAKLESHAIDLLPPQIATVADFLDLRAKAAAAARDPNKTEDERTEAGAFFASLEPTTSSLLNLFSFELLRQKFDDARRPLFVLASIALLGLGVFAVFSGPPKKSEQEATAPSAPITLAPGKGWAEVAQALTAVCGDATHLKAQIVDRPQPDWVELRLLAPEACAGMTLTLPTRVVIRPGIEGAG